MGLFLRVLVRSVFLMCCFFFLAEDFFRVIRLSGFPACFLVVFVSGVCQGVCQWCLSVVFVRVFVSGVCQGVLEGGVGRDGISGWSRWV